ncbi:MAG: polyprenyl synthetase family protein [Pseudomonadota bacterium]
MTSSIGAAVKTPTASEESASSFHDAVAALRTLTADDLTRVNEAILGRMKSPVSLIPELAGHLINAGGKRVRPMLTLAAANLLDYRGDNHVKLAAAVELIHGATLLHDDVVDASMLRRGVETANTIWGNKESVLVGDFVFSRSFELMVDAGDLRVLQVLSRASCVIAEGEVLQLSTQNNTSTTYEMYLAVVEAKTAALFAAAAQSGALIAGANETVENALRNYGRNLGVAYQLVDDALDYAGFESMLGKTVGDDFREGKMTLPVVYAIERAQSDETAFWDRVMTPGRQQPEDFERARELMIRDDAIVDTIACAKQFAQAAVDDLSLTPDNEYATALVDLVESSVARVF